MIDAFFFFEQKTAYEMRISDWSSDVCSSDLVLAGLSGTTFTVEDLATVGVKRISVGSALARLAYGACLNAAQAIAEQGTFGALSHGAGFADLEARVRSFDKPRAGGRTKARRECPRPLTGRTSSRGRGCKQRKSSGGAER